MPDGAVLAQWQGREGLDSEAELIAFCRLQALSFNRDSKRRRVLQTGDSLKCIQCCVLLTMVD